MAPRVKNIRVPQIDGHLVTKAQEIAMLGKIVDAIPKESYLSSLLNIRLYEWFVSRVKNDFWCDLMREHTDLEQQAEDLGKSVNGIREDCDAELKAIKESMSSMEHDYTAWAKEVESQRNTEAQMHSKISLLEDRLETSRQEVITLKARMYDMMHPGETGLDVKARLYEMEHEEGGDG